MGIGYNIGEGSQKVQNNSYKEFACNEGDPGLIPGLGRSSGEGNVYPLQYSCLENSMDRGGWWTTVHGVTKSWTLLGNFHVQPDTLFSYHEAHRFDLFVCCNRLCVGVRLSKMVSWAAPNQTLQDCTVSKARVGFTSCLLKWFCMDISAGKDLFFVIST